MNKDWNRINECMIFHMFSKSSRSFMSSLNDATVLFIVWRRRRIYYRRSGEIHVRFCCTITARFYPHHGRVRVRDKGTLNSGNFYTWSLYLYPTLKWGNAPPHRVMQYMLCWCCCEICERNLYCMRIDVDILFIKSLFFVHFYCKSTCTRVK